MRIKFRAGTAAAGLLLALAVGSQALAQGLGEITLDSAINEPLRAHIVLLDADKLDASQVKVALASPAEFQLAGVQRTQLLDQLKFEVEIKRGTPARIVVTSAAEISEPYLNFLVGVSWPSGRTLREYTLLLDLPKRNTVATPPTITRSSPSTQPAGTGNQSGASQTGTQQHEVKRGETLQQIAEQTRPSGQVGVQQMMIAIQRANEDAFVNNNVNRILVGKVLRIPRMDEIQLIDQDAAVAQVNAQNQALASETLAANDNPAAKAPARDELTLLSGDQDGKAGGSNDLNATIKQLESQLMVSEENLDRARLENLELTNRLSAIQEQIDTLQNIIAIEDDRIAQLQAQLGKQSAATQQALAKVEESTASGEGEESGLVAMLGNSMVLLGGVLAVALGVAMMMFIRRRNAQAALAGDSDANLDTLADEVEVEKEPSAFRMALDGLLARFRRKETLDEEEDVTISEEAVAAIAADKAPVQPVAKEAPTTDKLLDEMGFTNDFMAMDSDLGEVETARVEPTLGAEPVAEVSAALPSTDDAIAEAGSVMQEAALLDQALDEAEAPVAESQPETASVVTAPDTFAFTSEPVEEEPEVATESVAEPEDKPEVFEFSLPNLEESAAGAEVEIEQEDKPESISFDTSALALDATLDESPAASMPMHNDELEVLSFDEDAIKMDDEAEEIAGDDGAGSMDTHDARLDLAVAYEAMGDLDGAIEILDEVIQSGRSTQVAEAQRLKQKWKNG